MANPMSKYSYVVSCIKFEREGRTKIQNNEGYEVLYKVNIKIKKKRFKKRYSMPKLHSKRCDQMSTGYSSG